MDQAGGTEAVGDVGGKFEAVGCIGDGVFGLSSGREVGDAVADGEGCDVGAEGDDVAFAFAAEGVRKGGRGVEAGAEVLMES